MKLTGTNRSIGLIVPIAHAHQTKFDDAIFCPHAVGLRPSLRTARRTSGGSALPAAGIIRIRRKKTCSKRSKRFTSFSSVCAPRRAKSCALPTWWFWRGGCTRSHSEHGRETPQRRWYFVLRRGRVGRCQVCKSQEKQNNHLLFQTSPNNAGWSSPVARQAHNLKAAGSNPAPATKSQATSRAPRFSEPFLRSCSARPLRVGFPRTGAAPPSVSAIFSAPFAIECCHA